MLVIDTDNALGQSLSVWDNLRGGDVDDAFAITYLVCKRLPLAGVWNTTGNTTAADSYRNTLALMQVLGANVPCCLPNNVPETRAHVDFLALGPLTNLAMAMTVQAPKLKSVWVTLGRMFTQGCYPPFWPMEFNLTQDFDAFKRIAEYCEQQHVPLIVSPLDAAGTLMLTPSLSAQLRETAVGQYLLTNIKRWQWRNALLKGSRSFAVWDLYCALAYANPSQCPLVQGTGYLFANGLFLCDVLDLPRTRHRRNKAVGRFPIQVVVNLDIDWAWQEFFSTLASFSAE